MLFSKNKDKEEEAYIKETRARDSNRMDDDEINRDYQMAKAFNDEKVKAAVDLKIRRMEPLSTADNDGVDRDVIMAFLSDAESKVIVRRQELEAQIRRTFMTNKVTQLLDEEGNPLIQNGQPIFIKEKCFDSENYGFLADWLHTGTKARLAVSRAQGPTREAILLERASLSIKREREEVRPGFLEGNK